MGCLSVCVEAKIDILNDHKSRLIFMEINTSLYF